MGSQWVRGGAAHRNDCKRAARVDRDTHRLIKFGASAVPVEVALLASAGERGGLPGGDVDAANAVVVSVLPYRMGGGNTMRKSREGCRRRGWTLERPSQRPRDGIELRLDKV